MVSSGAKDQQFSWLCGIGTRAIICAMEGTTPLGSQSDAFGDPLGTKIPPFYSNNWISLDPISAYTEGDVMWIVGRQ